MESENKLNLNEEVLEETPFLADVNEAGLSDTEEFGLFNPSLWQNGAKKQQVALDLLNGIH